MKYVVALAVHNVEQKAGEDPQLLFDYPDTVADIGKHCDHIDAWTKAEIWAGVAQKLEAASRDLRKRVQSALDAANVLGVRFEEALAIAKNAGTISLSDEEFALLRLVCNGSGSSAVFQVHPTARLTPIGLMAFWPVLKSLTIDVGEPMEPPPLEGWLLVD